MSVIYINPYALESAGAAPPVAGAVLWVDASTLATGTVINAATTPVANLGSQGGTFNVGEYDVIANGIGTRNALRFNGTSQYLRSTNAYTNTGATMTVFAVIKRISTGSNFYGYLASIIPGANLDYQDARNFAYSQEGSGTTIRVDRNNAALATLSHAGNGVTFIGTLKFDGTNLTHYQKTTAASTSASGASSGNFGCTTTALAARLAGSGGAPNLFIDAFFGEVLIYNTALNDTNRLAVISYLSTKWGV